MPKLLESIAFAPQKWDEVQPELLPKIQMNVYEGDKGLLNLHLMINSECMQLICGVCPHHFREQVSFFWMGLEQGYDMATNELS